MKAIISTLIFYLSIIVSINGQSDFTATVSNDSILLGNHFQVTFNLENQSGNEFHPPNFSDYEIVSGPNQSMSSSFMNGEMTQSLSYSYYLKPKDIGTYYIEPADIATDKGILETAPIEINVYPNPDNIKQEIPNKRDTFDPFKSFDNFDFFEFPSRKQEQPKKKRRVYKI